MSYLVDANVQLGKRQLAFVQVRAAGEPGANMGEVLTHMGACSAILERLILPTRRPFANPELQYYKVLPFRR
jgi:hypothetical protein